MARGISRPGRCLAPLKQRREPAPPEGKWQYNPRKTALAGSNCVARLLPWTLPLRAVVGAYLHAPCTQHSQPDWPDIVGQRPGSALRLNEERRIVTERDQKDKQRSRRDTGSSASWGARPSQSYRVVGKRRSCDPAGKKDAAGYMRSKKHQQPYLKAGADLDPAAGDGTQPALQIPPITPPSRRGPGGRPTAMPSSCPAPRGRQDRGRGHFVSLSRCAAVEWA